MRVRKSVNEMLSLHRIALLVVVLLGTALRLYGLGFRSIWIVEAGRAGIAKLPIGGVLDAVVGISQSPPLGDYVLNIWRHLVGFGEFQLRFVSAVAGILCILLAYAVACLTLDSRLLALWVVEVYREISGAKRDSCE